MKINLPNFRREVIAWWVLIGLAVAGSLVRFSMGITNNPMKSRFSEMNRYWQNGDLGRFVQPDSFLQGMDAPVYQVFVLVLRQVTQDHLLAIGILIGLLSALTPWIYFWAARKFGLGRVASAAVLVLLAWSPTFMALYWFFINESLVSTLIGLGLLAAAYYQASPSVEKWLLTVFAWTVAALTNGLALPLGLLLLGWLWWTRSRRWSQLGLAAGLVALVILPNSIRTWSILGYPAPFGSDWLNRLQYTSQAESIRVEFAHSPERTESVTFRSPNRGSARHVLKPLSEWEMPSRTDVVVVPVQKRNGEADWRNALRRVKDDKEQFIARWTGNLLYLAVAPTWPEPYQEVSFIGYALNLQRWLWGPLILMAGAMSLVSLGMGNRDLLVIGSLAACVLLISQNNAFFEGRDRKPVEPIVLLGVVWMFSRRTWSGLERFSLPSTEPASTEILLPELNPEEAV